MAETEVKTIITVETGQSAYTLGELRENVKKLKSALDEQEVGSKEYQKTLEDLQVSQNALRDAMYGTTTSVEDLNKSANGLSDSYNSLVHRMAALKNEFRSTNDAARRADLGNQIKDINDQLKAMDALQGNFQRNVGNYTESIKNAFKDMSEGIDNFGKAAGVSINGVKNSFDLLSKTPLLGVVSLLVNAFSQFKDGLDKGSKSTKDLTAAIKVFEPFGKFLSGLIQTVGKYLAELFETVSSWIGGNGLVNQVIKAISGIGNAIVEFIIAPVRGIIAAVKVFKEQGIKGFRDAAKAFGEEAKKGWVFKQNYKAGQEMADAIIKGAKSKKKKGKDTVKELLKDAFESIGTEIEKNIAETEKKLDTMMDIMEARVERSRKAARDSASRLLEGLDDYTEHRLALNDIETKSEREKAEKAYAIQEESNRRRLGLLKKFADEAISNGDLEAAFKYQQEAADMEVKIEENALREKKRLRELDKADRRQMLESTVQTVSGVLSSLASIYEADDKASAAQLKRARAMKVASAIMTTLQGAVSAYVSGVESGIPAPGNIILGAAQAATVTAAGMANVAQIKRTNPGDSGTVTAPVVQAPSVPTSMNTTRSITTASEEDRLNYMARDQRVVLVMSDLEATQGQRRVQLAESSF